MFDFLPHQLFTQHASQSTSGISPALWSRLTEQLSGGHKRAFLVGDDFACPKAANTYVDLYSEVAHTGYIDTGGTIVGLADEKGGVLALNVDATGANEETHLSAGDGTIQLGQISDTAADAHLTVFEARYKVSSIANSGMPHFVGLASPGLAGDNTIVDTTGALISTGAFLGFRTLLDGDSIDFVYQAASQTLQTVVTGAHVPVADTFVKVGWVYDPDAPTAYRIRGYVNNAELGTYVTGTNIAAATFPDAEALTFHAGLKSIAAAAMALELDWWGFGQLLD